MDSEKYLHVSYLVKVFIKSEELQANSLQNGLNEKFILPSKRQISCE